MWSLQGKQVPISAFYVTNIWIVEGGKASTGLMDVVCRSKMIKRKISSTWVKWFQVLMAVFTAACFILRVWSLSNRTKVKIWNLSRLKWASTTYAFLKQDKSDTKKDSRAVNMHLSNFFLCFFYFSSYQNQNELCLSDQHVSECVDQWKMSLFSAALLSFVFYMSTSWRIGLPVCYRLLLKTAKDADVFSLLHFVHRYLGLCCCSKVVWRLHVTSQLVMWWWFGSS